MIPIILMAAGALYAGAKAFSGSRAGKQAVEKNSGPAGLRQQQLQTISSNGDERLVSEAEQETDHYLAASVGAVALATAAVFFPPLRLFRIPVIAYTCIPLFRSAYEGVVEEGRLKVSVLDSLSDIGALATGYYIVCAVANVFYYTGEKIVLATEDNSRKSLIDVFVQHPRYVWLLREGTEIQIAYEEVALGNILVVSAGETISVDGQITDGMATVDQHTLTGEAQPVEKGVGDPVFATTVVLSGRICIRVEKSGAATVAGKIGEILNSTAEFKASIERRSEVLAERTVLPTLGLSALALAVAGPVSAIAVTGSNYTELVRVAAPLGMLNFLHLASQRGILIKDGRSLEVLRSIDTVVFDKTGTLTTEQPAIGAIHTCQDFTENELLTYAAAAEDKNSHPIARALRQAAVERALPQPGVEDAAYQVGYGIKVRISGHLVRVGSARFMTLEGIPIPLELRTAQEEGQEQGYTFVYIAIDDQLGGAIEMHAKIRPEATRVIQALRKRHLSVYILSGDNEHPTQKLAKELGVDHYFATALPEEKSKIIERMQRDGKSVCFVGDGINDAIALKKANASISLRGASTAAVDSAQVVLMDQSLNQLDELFGLARSFDANVKATLATVFIPGAISVASIFFLNFGILTAVVLYNVSLIASMTNAMLPWMRRRRDEDESLESDPVPHQDIPHQGPQP
ncbi:MAG TPA: heavy metal translocating P-type ATPase [Thermoanaerobaculia bacterium]|jgi:Cu2+-exporting ATPase|nr:heavy metal translocating P-type ATPase [Thermoanaerobaculia bacterium]